MFLHRSLKSLFIQFVPNIQQKNNAFIPWTFISRVVFTWIRGIDEQLIVSQRKLVMENDVILWLHCHLFPHYFSHTGTQSHDPCVSCIDTKHGFNRAYCDCNCFTSDAQEIGGEMKSWKMLQYWVWTNGQRWWRTDWPDIIWWRSQKPVQGCRTKEELIYFIFNNVKHWVCKIYMFCVFTLNCLCEYSFCCVECLIVKHMISMAAISKLA
jgi:hypothetical protein